MHKLTANTDGLTEVAASQRGSTDLEIRAEQIATAAMGELNEKMCGDSAQKEDKNLSMGTTVKWKHMTNYEHTTK